MHKLSVAVFAIVVAVAAPASADLKSLSDADLKQELDRCKRLSIDARLKDTACDDAAKENTRRFIGNGPVYTPVPVDPFPSVPKEKLDPPKKPLQQ